MPAPLRPSWSYHEAGSLKQDESHHRALEVLRFRTSDAQEGLGVVVVGGNPGLPHFYCEFAEQVLEELREAGTTCSAAYVIGYPNFRTDAPPVGGVLGVDVEASSMAPAFERIAAEHCRSGVVLVGHSIGAWCVAQLLMREGAAKSNVALAVFACPYLEFDSTGIQRIYSAILSQPWFLQPIVWLLSRALAMLPKCLKKIIAPIIAGSADEIVVDQMLQTFGKSPHHFEGMIYMFRSEMKCLAPDATNTSGIAALEPLFVSSSRPKLLFLYSADGDHWGPPSHAARVKKLWDRVGKADLPRVQVHDIGQAPHSILSPATSSGLAKAIAAEVASTAR